MPAGIDRFPRELMEKYFTGWCRELGVSLDELMGIGHEPGTTEGEVFNMAAMGLRMAGQANGVAQLHGDVVATDVRRDVARDPGRRRAHHGGHQRRARADLDVAGRSTELYRRVIGPDWPEATTDDWRAIDTVPDRELWRARTAAKERLVGYARHKLRNTALRHGHDRRPGHLDRRRRSTPTSSPSGSPAASPPTSGPRCCSATSTACADCSSTPTSRCS